MEFSPFEQCFGILDHLSKFLFGIKGIQKVIHIENSERLVQQLYGVGPKYAGTLVNR